MSDLEFLLLLLLGAGALVRVADLIHVPYPIALVLGGLAVGLVPSLPDVEIEPETIFVVFLPPLLSSAGFYASPRELRAETRALTVLTLALVLVTMCAVAVVAHTLIDSLSWPAAFVLGAVLGPTDPVAASATFQRLGVPERVSLLVEGEAMLNDASALVAFRVALVAATTGTFTAADAGVDFLTSTAGGIAVGVLFGSVQVAALRRLDDRALSILLTLLFPYGAYIVAEQADVSGVLAVVVTGLWLGWNAHLAFRADTRLSGIAFWEVLEFGLNAAIFVLLGLLLPDLVDDVRNRMAIGGLLATGALIALVVIAVRMATQFVPGVHPGEGWRERFAIGYSGMRGAVSLAAALSVPEDVPGRDELVVVTVVVILVTLVGQGLSLPVVLRALNLRAERMWSADEAVARLEAAQSALDRLDELEDEGVSEEQLRRLRDLYRARFRKCQAVLGGELPDQVQDTRLRFSALRAELIGVERSTLVELRSDGRLRPDLMRVIERDLDLEEARLRTA